MAANTPSYDVFQGAERGLLPRPRSRHRPERMQPVAYLYLLPVIVSAIIFTIGPFLYTIYISFTNYNRLRNFQEFDWIGWRNYERVFEAGSDFFPVLGWTFGFMVLTTIFNVGFGGSSEKYILVLAGEDGDLLSAHARRVEQELRTLPGIGAVTSTSSLQRPELVVRPDAARAADLGVTAAAIANAETGLLCASAGSPRLTRLYLNQLMDSRGERAAPMGIVSAAIC